MSKKEDYRWLKVFPMSFWTIGWIWAWDAYTRTFSEIQLFISVILVLIGGIPLMYCEK